MALLGLTGALGNIALDTHVMQNADQEVLARVTSVGRLASFTACSIGPIIGGILVREFGNQQAMSRLFFLALIPLAISIFTIAAPGTSHRRGRFQPKPEPARDAHAGYPVRRLEDLEDLEDWRAAQPQDPWRNVRLPVPVTAGGISAGEDENEADEEELAPVQPKGGTLRLLAGVTIALVMTPRRADR